MTSLFSNPIVEKIHALPKWVEYNGIEKLIYRVKDKEGEHFLFVTQTQLGEFGTKDFRSEIRAYKFSRTNPGFKKVWEIYDFNPNPLTTVEWEESGFVVGDWDGDGIVESALVYKLAPDGLEDEHIKLISYYKDKKYAIRAILPRQEGKDGKVTKEKSISTLPKKVQREIEKIWGRLVRIPLK
jgi:hypothetical protein